MPAVASPDSPAYGELCVLSALGRQNALKLNFEMAINNGATVEEIFEALFQVAAYAGFPAAWDALTTLEEVLAGRRRAD
ncbi:MAG: carboxymuconolactone decarboxylase family protein [Desulfurivibrio sp.]|nr:carboxymuconolactone decarboxylase family protein [Desulfurivibrio sp.]